MFIVHWHSLGAFQQEVQHSWLFNRTWGFGLGFCMCLPCCPFCLQQRRGNSVSLARRANELQKVQSRVSWTTMFHCFCILEMMTLEGLPCRWTGCVFTTVLVLGKFSLIGNRVMNAE